jgi:hypothetical protein
VISPRPLAPSLPLVHQRFHTYVDALCLARHFRRSRICTLAFRVSVHSLCLCLCVWWCGRSVGGGVQTHTYGRKGPVQSSAFSSAIKAS